MTGSSRRRRLILNGARIALGALVLVGGAAGVSAGVAAPWPTVQTEPVTSSVEAAAGDVTLVCNGPFRVLGREVTNAAQITAAGNPAQTIGGEASARTELAAPDLVGQDLLPGVLTRVAEGSEVQLLAAAEAIALDESDAAGLAAAACREPQTESWLIGGAVETGANDIVVLSNPGAVAATVTFTVYGAEEPLTETLVVPAQTQLSVPLASSAAGLSQPIIRVTAQGAPVRAVLQSVLMRTLDPAGIDLQDGVIASATTLRFAGLQVVAESVDAPVTILRMMATEQDTQAVVRVHAADSGSVVSETTVSLTAEVPAEVNLDGLDPALYSVDVTADSGIVGAVWQSTGATGRGDFAWMTPAPSLAGEVMVAVPQGPQPRLHLQGVGTPSTVTVTATDGSFAQEVDVPTEGAVSVDVAPGLSYTLTPSAPFSAAVTLSGDNALAGWPIWPSASAEPPVTVYR